MISQVPKLKLSIQHKGQSLGEFLYRDFPVLFGRSSDCHLALRNLGFLSRVHGSISVYEDSIFVTDLNSKNGIVVDGKRVENHKFQSSGRFQVEDLSIELSLTEEKIETAVALPKPWQEKTSPVIPIQVIDKEPGRRQAPRTAFTIEPDAHAQTAPPESVCVQAILTWNGDVMDVRQFYSGELIRVGPDSTQPIYVPTAPGVVTYGQVKNGEAFLALRKVVKWRLLDTHQFLEHDDLKSSGQVTETVNSSKFHMKRSQVVSIQVGPDLEMHLRYIEIPRLFLPKSWIENKEEFKKAIRISAAVHVVVALLLLFGAPKTDAPVVEKVPPRFAKLLVQPPIQVFKSPPPPPPPPPAEEKSKPEPPKKVAQKKKTPSRAKVNKVTQAIAKPTPRPQPTPPQETALSGFEGVFAKTPSVSKLTNVQVTKVETPSDRVSSGDLIKTLSAKGGKLAPSLGSGALVGGVGNVAMGAIEGRAGKSGVKGKVVGRVSFESPSGPQGLSQKEIMAVVNRNISQIQQCYERSLLDNSSLSGRMEFEWTISAQGKVSGVSVKRSDISGGENLGSCVIGVIQKMKFPSASNGQSTTATIGFPFGRS